ncbi:MAG: NADH-quinone oxidoreductase subunit NuoB [Cyanobacteria bacterium HKST-UBA01]|nr:NADH-quinone oxidoreductase subunit NuoB [Cyanobacteria bacterium HKST-UBA01]
MLKSLVRILKAGTATQKEIFPNLSPESRGLPAINKEAWESRNKANGVEWTKLCPTEAISVRQSDSTEELNLDLGRCIACGLCPDISPDGIIEKNLSTKTAVRNRQDLVLSTADCKENEKQPPPQTKENIFKGAVAIRVVSTGCSACDLEVSAAFNPIFDMERFGIQLVASPRLADILMVTGPAGKGMQKALFRTYEAMPEPRLVIATGSCAISGGMHGDKNYASTGGVGAILPVDAYVPGCPPHPWSIIHSVLTVMEHKELSK